MRNSFRMQTVLLDRIARIEQVKGINICRLQVRIQKSVIKQEMITIPHRCNPTIRKKPRQCAHGELAQRHTFLSG